MRAPYAASMDTYERRRHWLHELLKEHSAADLARRSGIDASIISRYLYEPGRKYAKRLGEENARKLESAGYKPPGWLDRQHSIAGEQPPRWTVAQDLSHPAIEDAPYIGWGALMSMKDLPETFWLTVEDDAMAPRVKPGRRVCFDRRATPRAGDGVLVADAEGTHQFRLYRSITPERWVAAAVNPAYADRDSSVEPLRVVAVLIAEEGRWT